MYDILLDTVLDTIKLIPFLFVTYAVLEYLEHRTSEKTTRVIAVSGKLGPLIGSVLGVVPQCGFSAVASNFYAGRVISLGTLFAVFLSTSDEMLPILISQSVPVANILKILGIKVLVGLVIGYCIDLLFQSSKREVAITEELHTMCENEHCHCEHGIFRSALVHTLRIGGFIFLLSLLLNALIVMVGEESLSGIILNQPVLGPILSGLVGMIPNCASSVVITQVYLSGAMTSGAMLAGLLVNAGVGYLVLFRINRNLKENIGILAMMYGIGTIVGILFDLLGFAL